MIFLKCNKTRKRSFYFRTQWCTVSAHHTWEIIKNSPCYHSYLLYCILNTCGTGEIFMNSNPWISFLFFFKFQSQINELHPCIAHPLKIKKKQSSNKTNLLKPKYLNKLFTNIWKTNFFSFSYLLSHKIASKISPKLRITYVSNIKSIPFSPHPRYLINSILRREIPENIPLWRNDQSHGRRPCHNAVGQILEITATRVIWSVGT